MTSRDIEIQLEALMALDKHPGWLMLVDHLKKRSDMEMSAMRNAKSQDELLKHTYTYMALADLPNAPKLLGSVLQQHLTSHKK